MNTLQRTRFAAIAAILWPLTGFAQVNSGSNGSDGALNPTSDLVIDMADHPDGIYHYTSVNIPAGVTVSFIPNAGNKPVVWLVQGDCVISGTDQMFREAGYGDIGGARRSRWMSGGTWRDFSSGARIGRRFWSAKQVPKFGGNASLRNGQGQRSDDSINARRRFMGTDL